MINAETQNDIETTLQKWQCPRVCLDYFQVGVVLFELCHHWRYTIDAHDGNIPFVIVPHQSPRAATEF
jgi:hypothetical protein